MRRLKILGTVLVVLCSVYAVAVAGAYIAMRQPPERFGSIMAHVPMPAMIVIPFRPLWMSARAGELSPGDPAPDFELPTVDHSRTIRLSEQFRERPVVLIFGSYT